MLKKLWTKVTDWTGWSTAGSIFKARMEQFFGIVGAGVAGLLAFDWMPFITDTINWVQVAMISAYLFITGTIGEITRRWNTKTVDGHLVPAEVVVDRKKTAAKVAEKNA